MKLTINEITFLSALYEGKTPLSLFANVQAPLDGTESTSLADKGVMENGVLTEAAKEILDIVAMTKKCARVMLKDSNCVVEKYTYKVDNNLVLVENAGGEMLFSMNPNFATTMSELAEFTGMSRIKNTELEILLSVEEMLVLLAIIDIYRKNALLSYVGTGPEKAAVAFSEIIKQLDTPVSNSFVVMLKKNYNYLVPEAKNAKSVLDKLVAKNCIAFNDGYELLAEYAIFAKSMLIPETILMLEALNIQEKGAVSSASALCICAGIKDCASLLFSKNEIELTAISGMQLLQMTENMLKCPEISEE
ncbi:MAG: hypothetical protein WCI30_07060 [Clostridia bacterium]